MSALPLPLSPVALGLTQAILWTSLAVPAVAQEGEDRPVPVRRYLPRDYDLLVAVDVAGLIEVGLYDELLRMPLAAIGDGWVSRSLGFSTEDVDRVTLAARRDEMGGLDDFMMVATGTERLSAEGLAVELFPDSDWRELNGLRVFGDEFDLLAVPRPGMLFWGNAEAVTAVSDPAFRGGVPEPVTLALAAGPPTLCTAAWKIYDQAEYLPATEAVPADVRLLGATMRLRAVLVPGQELGVHSELEAELRLRFAASGAGPEIFARDWRQHLEDARDDPSAGIFPEMLELYDRAVIRIEGRDLVGTLRFEDGRELAARTVGDAVKGLGLAIAAAAGEAVRVVVDGGVRIGPGEADEAAEAADAVDSVESPPPADDPPADDPAGGGGKSGQGKR